MKGMLGIFWFLLLFTGIIDKVDGQRVINKRQSEYDDTNDYSFQYKCGDIFIRYDRICHCGNVTLMENSDQYCCVASGVWGSVSGQQCQELLPIDSVAPDGECEYGQVKDKSEPCYGNCYNSYQTSEYLSKYAHYHCLGNCVNLENSCQGIRYCESDVETCDEDLRCINVGIQMVRKNITTELIKGHNYCFWEEGHTDNGVYDNIDRSDETNVTRATEPSMNLLHLEISQDSNGRDGILCGKEFRPNYQWCTNERMEGCKIADHNGEEIQVSVDNKQLCGNTNFWSNISCNSNSIGHVLQFGSRCRGSQQHCYYPWYHYKEGRIQETYKTNCIDHTDEVFPINTKCSEFNLNLVKNHTNQFCNSFYEDMKFKNICQDPEAWFTDQTDPRVQDPHKCEKSCEHPDKDCIACTNKDYFQCSNNICIHPSNKCDGHPQCPGAEDEKGCYEEYLERKIVTNYATLKCNSSLYPGLKVYIVFLYPYFDIF